jgi:hypothetical protein
VLILDTAVGVGLVDRSVNIHRTLGGRDLLLLSVGHGEVASENGSLDTVTVEDVVFRVVNVVIALDSANVSDGLGLETRKSTVGLLVTVGRRV